MKLLVGVAPILLLALAAHPHVGAAGQLEDGLAAYRKGDWDIAMPLLQPLAERGQADAQFAIGMIHRDGKGALYDRFLSVKWIERAAENGVPQAQYMMGTMYDFIDFREQALRYFGLAAEQDHADAQRRLAGIYHTGKGVHRSPSIAAEWYYRAGFNYLREGGLSSVQKVIGQINAINPHHPLIEKLILEVYRRGLSALPEERETALRCVDIILAIRPDHDLAGALLGEIYAK